ncbi:hypothetical protein GIB67_027613 [Kingdonia uniflora]|uniref:non-specific serine/threonine protein kinase n=1 Tax=Kingdonia uniflora TaxID=39325 RepID=A0A7J7NKW6_9MAGN|nr:hypothetical protein GIB67_027613 [Kingdonia uniflora]
MRLEILNRVLSLWGCIMRDFDRVGIYSQRENNARIFQLFNEIENFKQGTQTLGMYYARLRSSWEELSHYDSFIEWQASAPSKNVPIPPTAAEIYAKIMEKTRVFQFLAGLNPDFEYARVHLLDMTPFPTLEEAHAYCLSDQSRQSPMLPPISGIPSEISVMAIRYAYLAPPSVLSQTSHTSSPSLSPLPTASGRQPPILDCQASSVAPDLPPAIDSPLSASAPSENVPIPPTAAEIYAKIVEKTRVFQFLAGINPDFEYARVHLLDRTPFPTLEEAHAYCLSDQSRRSRMPPIFGIPSETSAMLQLEENFPNFLGTMHPKYVLILPFETHGWQMNFRKGLVHTNGRVCVPLLLKEIISMQLQLTALHPVIAILTKIQEDQMGTDGHVFVLLEDSLKYLAVYNIPIVLQHATAPLVSFDIRSSFGESKQIPSRKHTSSKVILYILLLSVVLTTFAVLASLGCYVYRRDKCPIQPPIFSSDKDTSCNSATNLISPRSTSVQESNANLYSPVNSFKGFIRKTSFMFRSKINTIPGTITQFSYSELELATNKFSSSNMIGLGGSSHVYHGQLKDGRTVAVKRIKTQGGFEADSEFLTEIELISRLHHCHVVPLLGYCSESQGKKAVRLLVFEYMLNGNLRDCIDGAQEKELMDWGTRVNIALGAARGLEYLHEAAAPRILHRDVKSTNILLDDKWRGKITDLGMAKRLKADDFPSCSSSPARMQGTFGYFAPEYAIVGRASLKSDVFSFGVVLLELITGRHPIHRSSDKGEESLVIWATPRLQDSKRVISELPDPNLKGNFPEEEMQIMAYLAKECLLLDPDSRPTMSEVVQILSSIATEKSKRRNFRATFFQNSSSFSAKSVADVEKCRKQGACLIDAEELMRTTSNGWSVRRSLPLTIDRNLCVEDNSKDGDAVLSADYMDRLILLTSKARSWRAPDEEIVDLTEPRLETFWQANVQSL